MAAESADPVDAPAQARGASRPPQSLTGGVTAAFDYTPEDLQHAASILSLAQVPEGPIAWWLFLRSVAVFAAYITACEVVLRHPEWRHAPELALAAGIIYIGVARLIEPSRRRRRRDARPVERFIEVPSASATWLSWSLYLTLPILILGGVCFGRDAWPLPPTGESPRWPVLLLQVAPWAALFTGMARTIFYGWRGRSVGARLWRRDRFSQLHNQVQADEQGLTTTTSRHRTQTRWSEFRRFVESPELWIIEDAVGRAPRIIPKRAFASAAGVDAFGRLLRAHVGREQGEHVAPPAATPPLAEFEFARALLQHALEADLEARRVARGQGRWTMILRVLALFGTFLLVSGVLARLPRGPYEGYLWMVMGGVFLGWTMLNNAKDNARSRRPVPVEMRVQLPSPARDALMWTVFLLAPLSMLAAVLVVDERWPARPSVGLRRPIDLFVRFAPWVVLAAVVAQALVVRWRVRRAGARRWKRRSSWQLHHRLWVDERGITVDDTRSRTETPWLSVQRFVESQAVFLIYTGRENFQIIPKCGFAADAGVDGFRALLRKRVQPHGPGFEVVRPRPISGALSGAAASTAAEELAP